MNPAAIQVSLIAAVVAAVFSLVSKKLVNQDRIDEIQKKISDFQKRYNEARKRNDAEAMKAMEPEQKQMMSLTKELFSTSMKPTMITFVPAILVFFAISSVYGPYGVIADMPVLGQQNWIGVYIVVSLITAITIEFVYKFYRKRKKMVK